MVVVLGVDLRLEPPEDPEVVVGSEVDERESDGTRPGFPCGGGVEEEVADEIVRPGSGRRVDSDPVEPRRRIDAGPPDCYWVAGFGEDFWGDGDGDTGMRWGDEEEEEEGEEREMDWGSADHLLGLR